jgi:MFS family permease
MASRATKTSVLTPELRRIYSVVVLGSIMSVLDTTIVNVALDSLSRDLHTPLNNVQWVVTGYLLALAIVIPVTGWAVDASGPNRWMMSLDSSSLVPLCGWPGRHPLIAFRVLQAWAAAILPIGQSILARAAGPQRMGRG